MSQVLGIGTVTGGYYYAPDGAACHRLQVHWDDVTPRTVDKRGWVASVIKLPRQEFDEIANAPASTAIVAPVAVKQPKLSLDDCAAQLCMDKTELDNWVRAIHRKRRVVFYGPPGTGKRLWPTTWRVI